MVEDMTKAQGWSQWLARYGPENFYEAFMKTAQGAQGSCVHCGGLIFLDLEEGGGCVDWKTAGGDYGCMESPDTNDDGVGSHVPRSL